MSTKATFDAPVTTCIKLLMPVVSKYLGSRFKFRIDQSTTSACKWCEGVTFSWQWHWFSIRMAQYSTLTAYQQVPSLNARAVFFSLKFTAPPTNMSISQSTVITCHVTDPCPGWLTHKLPSITCAPSFRRGKLKTRGPNSNEHTTCCFRFLASSKALVKCVHHLVCSTYMKHLT